MTVTTNDDGPSHIVKKRMCYVIDFCTYISSSMRQKKPNLILVDKMKSELLGDYGGS